jgi:hypothetical protein
MGNKTIGLYSTYMLLTVTEFADDNNFVSKKKLSRGSTSSNAASGSVQCDAGRREIPEPVPPYHRQHLEASRQTAADA